MSYYLFNIYFTIICTHVLYKTRTIVYWKPKYDSINYNDSLHKYSYIHINTSKKETNNCVCNKLIIIKIEYCVKCGNVIIICIYVNLVPLV